MHQTHTPLKSLHQLHPSIINPPINQSTNFINQLARLRSALSQQKSLVDKEVEEGKEAGEAKSEAASSSSSSSESRSDEMHRWFVCLTLLHTALSVVG